MNHRFDMNFDLQLQLSDYLYNTDILSWIKLWEIDKTFYPAVLYTLRKNREINAMQFDLNNLNSITKDTVMTLVNNNQYNNLKYFHQKNYPFVNDIKPLLHRAIIKGYYNVVKEFIQLSEDKEFNYNIITAIRKGNYKIVKLLKLHNLEDDYFYNITGHIVNGNKFIVDRKFVVDDDNFLESIHLGNYGPKVTRLPTFNDIKEAEFIGIKIPHKFKIIKY